MANEPGKAQDEKPCGSHKALYSEEARSAAGGSEVLLEGTAGEGESPVGRVPAA